MRRHIKPIKSPGATYRKTGALKKASLRAKKKPESLPEIFKTSMLIFELLGHSELIQVRVWP